MVPCGARPHLVVKGAAVVRPNVVLPGSLSRVRPPAQPSSWRPVQPKRNPLSPLRRRWMA
jgi:hypothetical protein